MTAPLPLEGRTVLVTRPREQAGDLVRQLERQGARVLVQPMVEVRDPPDWGPVDDALTHLERYQWLIFTSANGIEAVLRRLGQLGRDPQVLRALHLAAIGPATAEALRRHGLQPDLVPEVYDSEHLADALRKRAAGQRLLLAHADRGRDVLRERLTDAAKLDAVVVYSQVDAEVSGDVLEQVGQGKVDFITLTSANIARSLARGLDEAARERIRSGSVRLATINQAVTRVVEDELKLSVAAEAAEATAAGVVAALIGLAGKPGERGV
jgi:uroporphyrinogen III methyltransferase/synthase